MSAETIVVEDTGETVSIEVADTITLVEASTQGPPGPVAADLPISDVQYDGIGRVVGYTRGGISFTVSYPDSTHIVVTGGGNTRTVTLDEAGRVIASV